MYAFVILVPLGLPKDLYLDVTKKFLKVIGSVQMVAMLIFL